MTAWRYILVDKTIGGFHTLRFGRLCLSEWQLVFTLYFVK